MEEAVGESKNVGGITVFPCLDLTDAGKRYFLTDLLNMEPAVPLQVIFQLFACFKCPHMPGSNWMGSLLLLPIMMNPDSTWKVLPQISMIHILDWKWSPLLQLKDIRFLFRWKESVINSGLVIIEDWCYVSQLALPSQSFKIWWKAFPGYSINKYLTKIRFAVKGRFWYS